MDVYVVEETREELVGETREELKEARDELEVVLTNNV